MNLVNLDAYPRGQVIINLDNVSIIRESDNDTVTIYLIDDTFVQVPHTMSQLSELIGARGL
jgi:hypothetical protein